MAHSFQHFTGKSGGGGSKRKRKSSRKERRANRGRHKSKYNELAELREEPYSRQDKQFRQLPIPGNTGDIVPAGFIALWHGRRYSLISDTKLDHDGMKAKFRLMD